MREYLSRQSMNQFQNIAMESYPDAEDIWSNGNGDLLFEFVLVELSGNEDCESLESAIERMNMAIADLELVRDALEIAHGL